MQNQLVMQNYGVNQNLVINQQQSVQDNIQYCICKGTINSELFVKCDGDEECPNGGWVHPQCTTDLSEKSKQELDDIEEYYCEDCRSRIKSEEQEDDQMSDENDLQENQELN